MNQDLCAVIALCFFTSGLAVSAKLAPEQREKLPPPAAHQIDFAREVKPIFEASCINCHGHGKSKGGFRLDSRETVLSNSDSGPAVIPNQSADSYLIELVSGLDPDNVMPRKGSKLTPEQVGVLRAWIDQGLPWEQGWSFGRAAALNLTPPEPKIPAGPAAVGPSYAVDLLLKPYFQRQQVGAGQLVSDRVFARRIYLDVIGLLPTLTELNDFLTDDHPDKRGRLARRLLADNTRYAQHWLTFWNDLLRNDYIGTGYIDDGRKQITGWLYTALVKNLPFDRFVAQLVNPTPESAGFVNGIIWRGVVNASQTPQMQAAQNISQVFMGVNLKCASCHDSFINDWTLADAYGLASVYAENELEMVHCDKPTGKKANMKFLYPELGAIDAQAPKAERLSRLAQIMTQKQNGRLSRTIVNRLWARFMGSGLVEPLDDMEQPAWNQDLLDWLAADLVENGYDLKKTIERIVSSQAYQLASVPATELLAKPFVFRGPLVRRLSAEQFQDALSEVTGVWHAMPASSEFAPVETDASVAETHNPASVQWIWNSGQGREKADPGTVYFRRKVELPSHLTQASAVVTCDNRFKLFVNGKEIASGQDHTKPTVVDLLPHLQEGQNLFAIAATNDPGAPGHPEVDQSNPAGLLCYFRIRQERIQDGHRAVHTLDFGTDAAWRASANKLDGWENADADPADWTPAVELGSVGIAPWNLEKKFGQALASASLAGHVRAALVAADPLMTALGRPNREQVITTRASAATTLQGLELTNGKTLAEGLARGSEHVLNETRLPSGDLVVQLFERALARPPKPEELALSQELVGTPVKKAGVEDLLWSLAMLPEFQLIY